MIVNPNTNDTSVEQAIELQGGDRWGMDFNITYPTGKTNVATAVTLGISSATNAKVTDSIVRGLISGGDVNLTLANTDQINLDALVLVNSENANNINLDITSGAINTEIGNLVRDGEIQDSTITTRRKTTQLNRTTTQIGTGAVTTEVDLMSYTLPADYLGKTGVLYIEAMGNITNTAGSVKTIKFKFGSFSKTLQAANVSGPWSAKIAIYQHTNRASQKADIVYIQGNTVILNSFDNPNQTGTSPIIAKFTGQTGNASDEALQESMSVIGA